MVNWEITRWSGYDDYLSDWESECDRYRYDGDDEDDNDEGIYDWMWR